MSLAEIEARVFMKGRNLCRFPIDLIEVVEKVRLDKPIRIIYKEIAPSDIGAFFHVSPQLKKHYIVVNKNHPLTRQRFSIAHEIGHLILGHEEISIHSWDCEDLYEWQANAFAAELLMPANELYELAAMHNRNISKLLDEVQRFFGVSLSAAAQRITRLGIFEGAIILKAANNLTYFSYTTSNFNGAYKTKYIKRLPSGKELNILVSETFIHLT